jgi:hypothetical protein
LCTPRFAEWWCLQNIHSKRLAAKILEDKELPFLIHPKEKASVCAEAFFFSFLSVLRIADWG